MPYYLCMTTYIEFRPGIQLVFNSRSRLDLTMGQYLSGRTYLYNAPLFQVNYQKYLFK